MHSITFAFKRAHLRAVAFGKKAVERINEMTPARFDLLYAIRITAPYHPDPSGRLPGLEQNELVRTLGLHRSTVAKMIKRLNALGWVTNDEIAMCDRRTRIVRLTQLGVRRIRKAMRVVLQQHVFRRWFTAFFESPSREPEVVILIEDFRSTIKSIAREFGDRSDLRYADGTEALDH